VVFIFFFGGGGGGRAAPPPSPINLTAFVESLLGLAAAVDVICEEFSISLNENITQQQIIN
jgi:hypothetical protein